MLSHQTLICFLWQASWTNEGSQLRAINWIQKNFLCLNQFCNCLKCLASSQRSRTCSASKTKTLTSPSKTSWSLSSISKITWLTRGDHSDFWTINHLTMLNRLEPISKCSRSRLPRSKGCSKLTLSGAYIKMITSLRSSKTRPCSLAVMFKVRLFLKRKKLKTRH